MKLNSIILFLLHVRYIFLLPAYFNGSLYLHYDIKGTIGIDCVVNYKKSNQTICGYRFSIPLDRIIGVKSLRTKFGISGLFYIDDLCIKKIKFCDFIPIRVYKSQTMTHMIDLSVFTKDKPYYILVSAKIDNQNEGLYYPNLVIGRFFKVKKIMLMKMLINLSCIIDNKYFTPTVRFIFMLTDKINFIINFIILDFTNIKGFTNIKYLKNLMIGLDINITKSNESEINILKINDMKNTLINI